MQGVERAILWNLFSRKPEFNVWCAVPVESAVPTFLFSGAWIFGGQGREVATGLPGLGRRVAQHGVALNGFYMFHRFDQAEGDHETRILVPQRSA